MSPENVNQEVRVRRNSPVIQSVIPDPDDLELIKQAAALSGARVSGFVRVAALKEARRVLQAESEFVTAS